MKMNILPTLGVPVPAGMSDSYKTMSRSPIRDGLPSPNSSIPAKAGIQWWGAGGANLPFLGVPAPTGMSDWYENSTGTIMPLP